MVASTDSAGDDNITITGLAESVKNVKYTIKSIVKDTGDSGPNNNPTTIGNIKADLFTIAAATASPSKEKFSIKVPSAKVNAFNTAIGGTGGTTYAALILTIEASSEGYQSKEFNLYVKVKSHA